MHDINRSDMQSRHSKTDIMLYCSGLQIKAFMEINQIIEETLSEEAAELLDMLAAHAVVSASASAEPKSMFYMPVEENNWSETLLLLREIFEAEILVADESDWLSFRILQSIGAKNGQLAYQFTPTFSQTLTRTK